MKKLDLKREYKHLYLPSARQVSVVDVPEFQFALIDGEIEPGNMPQTSPSFQADLGALYGISYTLKFMSKQRQQNPIDYTVMALEGLWWTSSGEFDFSQEELWRYRLMMMQPDHITVDMYETALAQLEAKKPNPSLANLRLERWREGLCLQIMHIGPYAEEPRTLARMKTFAERHGYVYHGHHHEIYLGDPRLAKPENLRTVLRHPVALAADRAASEPVMTGRPA